MSIKFAEHEVEDEAANITACPNDAHDFAVIDRIDEGDNGKCGTAHMLDEETEEYHQYDRGGQRNHAEAEADQEGALKQHGNQQRKNAAWHVQSAGHIVGEKAATETRKEV